MFDKTKLTELFSTALGMFVQWPTLCDVVCCEIYEQATAKSACTACWIRSINQYGIETVTFYLRTDRVRVPASGVERAKSFVKTFINGAMTASRFQGNPGGAPRKCVGGFID